MAVYLGKNWKKDELVSYIGDPEQIAGARASVLSDGKAEGVKAIDIDTGGGFRFTTLPGRGMDIPSASYKGRTLNFFSGTGVTAPGYYEEPGMGWLRSFYAGLLTTCGITYSGAPGVDQGQPLGLHGRIANSGAENLSINQEWEGDEYLISVKGRIREASLFGENMTLTRTIETCLGGKSFKLHDVIENRGFEPQPLMMLYHFNFGFPLLSPNARIVAPITASDAKDEESSNNKGTEECLVFPEPQAGYKEKVYFHTLAGSEKTFIALVNRDIGDGSPLGIVERFSRNELPYCTEWKYPCKGCYVLGLEPGTVPPIGRAALREKGSLPMLDGQQKYPVTITFEVVDTIREIEELEKEAESLVRE